MGKVTQNVLTALNYYFPTMKLDGATIIYEWNMETRYVIFSGQFFKFLEMLMKYANTLHDPK